jgi:uncharacterized membrane protein
MTIKHDEKSWHFSYQIVYVINKLVRDKGISVNSQYCWRVQLAWFCIIVGCGRYTFQGMMNHDRAQIPAVDYLREQVLHENMWLMVSERITATD